ncbi:MAG: PEP/pyruvate-binding domain-containing protein [Polyangia bacterium]
MKDRKLERIAPRREDRPTAYENLMPWRVRNILLVSSLYDAFTFQEDARLTEMLFSEYLELNLRYAPRIERVSTAEEAVEILRETPFDMVISMHQAGGTKLDELQRSVREVAPEIPFVTLANSSRELEVLRDSGMLEGADRSFVWHGDVRLFLAIIKSVEDRLNARHDALSAGVPCLILLEDNVRFYSSYLPLLYTELMRHTQALMTDGLNTMQKLLRMRARPKVLLATSWEEGLSLYEDYREHLMGVIADAEFPRGGRSDPDAGFDFAAMARERTPDRPVLIQSSDQSNARRAEEIGASFINKRSDTLLGELRRFLREHLGFAEFQFRMPDGSLIASASDLRSLSERIAEVPGESLLYHGRRNDFSSWLMARTEFDVARRLRPINVSEFDDAEEVRRHLLDALSEHRARRRAGVVAEFSKETFEGRSGFVRIGGGSLGGKGRGLAFVHSLLEQYRVAEQFSDVSVYVPPTAVLSTEIFDQFMERNRLLSFALQETDDAEIERRFSEASLPPRAAESLETFLGRVRYPLAVRSSSLLEDASYQPYAGVYRTCMIPNNHADKDVRLEQLVAAIKRVYASTYSSDAKGYAAATRSRLEEEKMAVVIQQVVGRRHGDYLYPAMSGVARSHNFYPVGEMKPEDGIASVVLGLGRMVVDGGRCVRFSPAHPRRLYQLFSPKEALNTTQSEFYALDLSADRSRTHSCGEIDSALVTLDLSTAEEHEVLHRLGSTYDADSEAIHDGLSRPGVRLVTLAGVLKGGAYPLAELLSYLLEIGSSALACPVEIEFAAEFRSAPREPHELGFLQIRPVVVDSDTTDVEIGEIDRSSALCLTDRALGHGYLGGVRDVVYLPPGAFDRSRTVEAADQVGAICAALRSESREFVLIGPGRWGSADRWLGIPVRWSQIAGARCIVETDLPDIRVTPSQGSHFFQNMTSLGVAYLTVAPDDDGALLDLEWLGARAAEQELEMVRHVRFERELAIAVNGRSGSGAILKPGEKLPRRAGDRER